eukprot:scaffold124195_cov27-Tisochrysis_lutea.AAC.1
MIGCCGTESAYSFTRWTSRGGHSGLSERIHAGSRKLVHESPGSILARAYPRSRRSIDPSPSLYQK